ncbi:cadherin repeat domain-containing protein, partial [Rubellimicrobium rubrum]|uniref:cadherin repeat domain-containing protein n=1 Tax=Rubellimicrobium rubrum TaxID=2585369 RepID=UPI00159BB5E5
TATDSTGNASQQTLTVTVLDLDDIAPVISGPSGGAGSGTAAKSVSEGTLAVHSFTGDEGVTWAIVGGTDQGQFTINPGSGELRFASGPDFEAPVDANTDNIYLVTVQATDGNGNSSQQLVTITVTDVAEDATPPAITGLSGAAGDATSAKTVDEGQTAVATFAANEVVTWSITGGSDQGRFAISPSTGALTFVAAPDYEAAGDTDGNNIYLVVVTATDGFGNASHQTVTITVADLNEDA